SVKCHATIFQCGVVHGVPRVGRRSYLHVTLLCDVRHSAVRHDSPARVMRVLVKRESCRPRHLPWVTLRVEVCVPTDRESSPLTASNRRTASNLRPATCDVAARAENGVTRERHWLHDNTEIPSGSWPARARGCRGSGCVGLEIEPE